MTEETNPNPEPTGSGRLKYKENGEVDIDRTYANIVASYEEMEREDPIYSISTAATLASWAQQCGWVFRRDDMTELLGKSRKKALEFAILGGTRDVYPYDLTPEAVIKTLSKFEEDDTDAGMISAVLASWLRELVDLRKINGAEH